MLAQLILSTLAFPEQKSSHNFITLSLTVNRNFQQKKIEKPSTPSTLSAPRSNTASKHVVSTRKYKNKRLFWFQTESGTGRQRSFESFHFRQFSRLPRWILEMKILFPLSFVNYMKILFLFSSPFVQSNHSRSLFQKGIEGMLEIILFSQLLK